MQIRSMEASLQNFKDNLNGSSLIGMYVGQRIIPHTVSDHNKLTYVTLWAMDVIS